MTAHPSNQEVVKSLVDLLGGDDKALNVAKYVSGASDRDDIDAWMNGTSAPTEEQAARLAVALKVINTVRNVTSPTEAMFWLGNGTIDIGDGKRMVAYEAIRAGMFDDVSASAKRLAEDGWS